MVTFVTMIIALMLAVIVIVLRFTLKAQPVAQEANVAVRFVQRVKQRISTHSRRLIALGLLLLGASAGLLYWYLGRSHPAAPQLQVPAQAGRQDLDLTRLTPKLALRLELNPEDGQGWALLGRSYVQLGQYAEAAKAFTQAAKRLPHDADVLADLTEALFVSAERQWTKAARESLAAALAAGPAHQKTLWLAGSEAFDRKAYEEAIRYWEKLSAIAAPDSDTGRAVQTALDRARDLAAGKG